MDAVQTSSLRQCRSLSDLDKVSGRKMPARRRRDASNRLQLGSAMMSSMTLR
jgi:hypothetical protein